MIALKLNPDYSVPLYIQLKEHLQMQIEAGVYAAGARLPSERQLAEDFNLSRMTARQALQLLSQDGLTQSRVGKGTYVRQRRIDQELRVLTGFTEDIQRQGLRPNSRVLKASISPADEAAAHRLRIPQGSEVVILNRVRLADNQPLAIENATINHQLCPNILEGRDFRQESLYRILREEYGCQLIWADQMIQARLPSDEERKLLHIGEYEPILSIERVTFITQDQPIEFVKSIYHGTHYRFRVALQQPRPTDNNTGHH